MPRQPAIIRLTAYCHLYPPKALMVRERRMHTTNEACMRSVFRSGMCYSPGLVEDEEKSMRISQLISRCRMYELCCIECVSMQRLMIPPKETGMEEKGR